MLVSAVQWSESAVSIPISSASWASLLPQPPSPPPPRSLHSIELYSLCYRAAFHELAISHAIVQIWGFPGGAVVKNLPANAGVQETWVHSLGWEEPPGGGKATHCPGGGNSNSLWYSCWDNLMDRGAWWATVHGVAKSDTIEMPEQSTHIRVHMSTLLCQFIPPSPSLYL